MRDKDQQLIFTKAELELLQSVFGDNEELLYAVRAVLLQFATPADWALVRSQLTPPVVALIRRRFLDNISPNMPFGQLGDIYQTLTGQLNVKTPDEMAPLFEAKRLERDYLEQQFAILEGQEVEEKIKLSDLAVITSDYEETFVNTTARNFLLGFIDPNMLFVKALAGTKEESMEAKMERLQRDSSK